jgi:hypothetical protein
MRPALFVSLALAGSVASIAASACDNRIDYNNKINGYLSDYRAAIDTANKDYTKQNSDASVRLYNVSLYSHPHGRQYVWPVFAYNQMLQYNLLVWTNSVNKAVADYNKNAQEAYDNACVWW